MSLRQPVSVPDGFGMRPSMSFFLYNQDGQQAIARPYLDGSRPLSHRHRGPSVIEPPMGMPKYHLGDSWDEETNAPSHNFVYDFGLYRFLVREQWQEVYAHDAEGRCTSGSLEVLVDAVSQGAEVKIAVQGLCDDLADAPMEHEVFVHLGSCYYYTDAKLLLACSHPVVRVAPAVPMQYRSGGWDWGWLMPRTDGFVDQTLYDPYTLKPRKRSGVYAMRWFIAG